MRTDMMSHRASTLTGHSFEITEFDPGKSTTFVKLEVNWEKGERSAAVAQQAATNATAGAASRPGTDGRRRSRSE